MTGERRAPPFDREGRFFRGNLHCHSNRSDGGIDPEAVVAAYKSRGYDFICLSDHFEASYGWQVTDTSQWRERSFTTLVGAELSRPGPVGPKKWWLGAAGLPLDFAPVGDEETGQQVAARARAAGAFVTLLHPGFNATRLADLDGLEDIDAVEIYNSGVQRLNDRGDGWYLATELLDQGRDITCVAADDAHFDHGGLDAMGGAWVQVRSPSLEPPALLAALKSGSFYSSMGPEIHDVAIDGRKVEIHCSPAAGICVTGPGSLARSLSYRRWDGRLQESPPLARVIERQDEGITRCQVSLESPGWAAEWGVLGPGDWWRVTVTDADGRRAWTNPARLGRAVEPPVVPRSSAGIPGFRQGEGRVADDLLGSPLGDGAEVGSETNGEGARFEPGGD